MSSNGTIRSSLQLKGLRISPGIACGTAFVYQDILERNHRRYPISAEGFGREFARVKDAIAAVKADLRLAASRVERDFDQQISAIFLAQEQMLEDAILLSQIEEELTQRLVNAEEVVLTVFTRWTRLFQQKGGSVSQRADDVRDLCRRLLRALSGIHMNILERLPDNSIVVARHLLPSDTVLLTRATTLGLVVEFGGSASHAAMLTRELGVPAVGRISGLLDAIQDGDQLLLDGTAGLVTVNPDPTAIEQARRTRGAHRQAGTDGAPAQPLRNAKGEEIRILANVSCKEDVLLAARNGADGIGLYRLEGYYLSRKVLPTAQELFEHLRDALSGFERRPVAIRLLDIGADKNIPYLPLPPDEEPLLGLRGVRVLLRYPDLLRTQLQALVLLGAHFPVRIIVPMLTVAEEMLTLRRELELQAALFAHNGRPLLGAMIETPAAALCAGQIARYADFLNLGTNDLTQYVMAAGRENELVENYFMDDHPAVLRLIRQTIADAPDLPISLCGELAGNPGALQQLLALGIRGYSVAPSLIPEIRDALVEQLTATASGQ